MKVYNIHWDTNDDNIREELPSEMEIPIQEAIYIDDIDNYLLSKTGFYALSYSF